MNRHDLETNVGPARPNTLALRAWLPILRRGAGYAVALLLLAPVDATAASTVLNLAPSEERASALFDAGKFDEAIAEFEALYAETSDANYLFNIGRIYEEGGRLAEALEYYERFVVAPRVELELRTDAAARIEAIRGILALDEDKEEAVEPDPESDDEASAPVDGGELRAESPKSASDEAVEPQKRRPSKLAIAGYATTGVGVAVLATGGIFGLLAVQDDGDLTVTAEDPTGLRDRGKRRAGAADGLFIGGGIVTAVGVSLIIASVVRSNKAASSTSRLESLRVSGGPGVFGVGLSGRL